MIQARRIHEVDEDLRVAGIASARRDAEGAATMRQQADLVAHERALAGVFVGAGAAALDDEVRRDAVERQAVVVALARQRRDVQRR